MSRHAVSALAWIALGLGTVGSLGCVAAPTYADVEPILEYRCASCHQAGIGPQFLGDYDQVSALDWKIQKMVTVHEMPPFGLDQTTSCGGDYFVDDGLTLGDDEIKTISDWVNGGGVEGDTSEIQQGSSYVAPTLREIDATLQNDAYAFDATVPASLHRCFVIDPAIATASFLTAFQVTPGNPSLVSNVSLYALDDDTAASYAYAQDVTDPGVGYHCFGAPEVPGARFVGNWEWGRPVMRYPDGTGLRIDAGAQFIVEVHYSAEGAGFGPATESTRIDLELTPDVAEASFMSISPTEFSLPPGLKTTDVHGGLQVTQGIEVLGVVPVMHELGRNMELDRVRPFSTTCMAQVDYWDLDNDQRLYQYLTSPPDVLPGDQLAIRCTYNTQSRIDPTWMGDNETDEACVMQLYTMPAPADGPASP